MLDEYKKNIRKPNPEELRLIKFLVQKASLNMSEGWERSLTVSCLNDGGMGSMKLYMSLPPKEIISTIFVSECSYGHEIEMYTVEQGEKRGKRQ